MTSYEANGFESCFIGIIERAGQPVVFVYDNSKAVKLLMTRDGMTPEEAQEFIYFNVVGAWIGPGTPAFLQKCSLKDARDMISNDV